MNCKKISFNHISPKVNSLTPDQLETLFNVYLYLNYDYNFFMSKSKHESFMNLYFETFTKHQPNTFKTLINLFTSYTYEHRYPHLLLAIDLIKQDHSLYDIINTVYHLR